MFGTNPYINIFQPLNQLS